MALLQQTILPAELPSGYTLRPVVIEDVEAANALLNQYSNWQSGEDQSTVEDLRNEWLEPDFSLADNTLSAWDASGQMAAYGDFFDRGKQHFRLYCWGLVHPDHQGNGLGSVLLDWALERARKEVPQAPEGVRVSLQTGILSTNERAAALLRQYGFNHTRSYYRMRIDFDEQAPRAPVLPEGITIRAIERGEEGMAIRCAFESFRDHYGFIEEPYEQYESRWMHRLENDTKYDPSLYFVALDGDEVAGVSLCYDHIPSDPEMGWVGTLGVRRQWRKRGLGTALLLHSFGEFHRRGKPRAGLGVDASSLTGAVKIYENAGMRSVRTYNEYSLELRPGIELSTQSAG
jgi:mycothiol synthase